MKKYHLSVTLLIAFPVASEAAIVSFEAESGTLGSGLAIQSGAEAPNASGGSAIVQNGTSNLSSPFSENEVATYTVTFETAATYNLWIKVGTDRGTSINGEDSVFMAARFGGIDVTSDTAADWTSINRFRIAQDTFAWFNVSAGAAPTGGGFNTNSATFEVTAPGDQTWQLGGREANFRIDAIAFASTNEFDGLSASQTIARLDNALIPEPSSTLLLGLFSTFLLGKRRRA